jgi:hypothetical protein
MAEEELSKVQEQVDRALGEFDKGVEELRLKGQMTPELEAQVAEVHARVRSLVAPAS